MSKDLIEQFAFNRNMLFTELDKLDESLIDKQLEGLNNTVRWHIGHILTVAEQFLFGFPNQSKHLPETYISLFGNGTKPADWPEEVPSLKELRANLQEQFDRAMKLQPEYFATKLEKPFLGQDTIGGLTKVAVFHEAHHTGQLHTISLLTVKQA
ncbi:MULTISPECIES: DinB family protein [Virgibacillus]|uniref:Formate dehydrogenase n=1 Tax=Virgibacillus pantothenticus TaxID=1473 RepID=A0A0L0QMS0_VIRPA|nr:MULTISPECIES: DinB family protein [Virgibacillus]API93244.1 formate dehydrogenase [Virgibacillus sp. 6R]KNE19523.1 formate dehydrogenase [Virgibacillus pantothenticus]MBS7428711.1 DinB family protein [Virgibacillus sp. 19R1-5]MBU8565760.1 DinB family protein [Virgibacillus pantothenticus]MBU8599653.1 DinB family protein [Virgibacillus pantothenticus]